MPTQDACWLSKRLIMCTVIFVAGRAADVKRCYSSRGALALLDFDDPSIQGVQALMIRAAMLPPFLRCADGRKFIAHLFTLHVSLQCMLHGWLKSLMFVWVLSSSVLVVPFGPCLICSQQRPAPLYSDEGKNWSITASHTHEAPLHSAC